VFRSKLPIHYRFLLLFTALIHDVEHPGHNNQWEVQVDSQLARKYKNEAVLENHSFHVTLRILSDPAYAIFQPFGRSTVEGWLKIVEELILATDFAVHRRFLDEFGRFLASHPVDYSDPGFLSWVSRALIKAADIANTSKPFPQAMVWGQRVMMEFWAQGVLEKERNYPVGPLNDPETVQLNAAQAGFIRFAVMELFEQLSALEPAIKVLVDNLRTNLASYEEKARAGDLSFE
jgi:high affinity cGMP-specific 3',5'-cyclic phosphodiesterase 9